MKYLKKFNEKKSQLTSDIVERGDELICIKSKFDNTSRWEEDYMNTYKAHNPKWKEGDPVYLFKEGKKYKVEAVDNYEFSREMYYIIRDEVCKSMGEDYPYGEYPHYGAKTIDECFEIYEEKPSEDFEKERSKVIEELEKFMDLYSQFTTNISPKNWRTTGTHYTQLKQMQEDIPNFKEISDKEREIASKFDSRIKKRK